MRVRLIGLAMAGLLLAGGARAQVAWDSPLLVLPQQPAGFGVYILDMWGGNTGIKGTWASGGARQSIGLQFGLVDGRRIDSFNEDGVSGFGGLTVSGTFYRASADFPLDAAWVLGGGAGFGDFVWTSFPAGVSLGRTVNAEELRITPYLSPRMVFDATFGLEDPFGNDLDFTDLDFAADIGVELALQPRWRISVAGTLGREAVAIGLAFQPSRSTAATAR